jgi:hypothetical protein
MATGADDQTKSRENDSAQKQMNGQKKAFSSDRPKLGYLALILGALGTIVSLTGCDDDIEKSKKLTTLQAEVSYGKPVYTDTKGTIIPPAEPKITQEQLFINNDGPQPLIIQPETMIIGDTGGWDPNNPNVWRGPRTDFVVINDWRWNEEALKAGANIRIPGSGRNPAVEELRIIHQPIQTARPNTADETNPEEPEILIEKVNRIIESSDDLNQIPGLPVDNTANQTTAQDDQTNATVAADDTLEIPANDQPPVTFQTFLRDKGEFYSELRKNLRALGLPARSQYEQAYRLLGPNEKLGYQDGMGWVAFRTKNWRDLSAAEQRKWLASQPYKDYLRTVQNYQTITLETPSPTEIADIEVPPTQPNEYQVKIGDETSTPASATPAFSAPMPQPVTP